MDDNQPHYDGEPQRSPSQWVKFLYALYELGDGVRANKEPVVHRMAEFEPVPYRSFAQKRWAHSLKRASSVGG